jgi:hypothetical protein
MVLARGLMAVLAADHTVAQLALVCSLAAAAAATAIVAVSVAAVPVVVEAELMRQVVAELVLAVLAGNTPFQALPPTMLVAAMGRDKVRLCKVEEEGRG